jgi:hypothetical protein
MAISESDNSCTITWNPRGLTLDDLAQFASLLAGLHSEVAVPFVTEALYPPGSNIILPGFPYVASMRMGSPLVVQLLVDPGGIAIASLGMIGYILRNPDKLGGFLPRIRESWHEGNRKALEAKLQDVEARLQYVEARNRVQTRGRSIERFQRELRSREQERELRNRGNRDDRPGRSR